MENNYEHLRNVRKAEWLADGFRLVGSFTLPERIAYVNGKPCGVTSEGSTYPIDIQGMPIGQCGFCGYMPLYVHYTILNKRTKELVNVGGECLADLFGTEKGESIKRAIQSIHRKVSSDYRRPFKQADIKAWLDALPNPTEARNKRIDETLAKYPHCYISVELDEFIPKDYKDAHKREWSYVGYAESLGISYDEFKERHFEEAWAKVPADKNNNQQAIRLQDAKKSEQRDRSFWEYNLDAFARKDWNPQTMKKEYERQAQRDGIPCEPIKWTSLTAEQSREEHNLIDTAINEWIGKVSKPRP